MLTEKDLRPKQSLGIGFIREGYESLILADVGTGKTVITLTALLEMNNNYDSERVLVLAPKRVCTDVWMQELDEWDHLAGTFTITCAAGKSEKKRREIIEDKNVDIVLLNYENLPWLMEHYPTPPFDTLVCDEIDKMKDRTTYRFKGRKWTDKKTDKERRYDGLKKYRKHFVNVIGLTGTPSSNHLMDLWAQAFVIDGGASLGRSFDKFQRQYFYQTDWSGFQWEPLPGAEKRIHDALEPTTFRIERDDNIPPIVELPPRYIDLPPGIMKQYKKFEKDFMIELGNGENIESPHAAAAYGKLRQMASGFAYYENERQEKGHRCTIKNTTWLSKDKFSELDSLISELQGQQVMIVYHFKAQLEELLRRHPADKLRYLGGGVSDAQASGTISEWNSGKLERLALHPASAGHGLNLQKSGAHHIVMLTQPESAGLYEQVVGRLRRTGNASESIFIHKILTRNTIDIEQDLKVQGKLLTQADFLAEMQKRCGT